MKNYLVAVFLGLLFIVAIVGGVIYSQASTHTSRSKAVAGNCGEGSGYVQMICRRKAGNLSSRGGTAIDETERFIKGYIIY